MTRSNLKSIHRDFAGDYSCIYLLGLFVFSILSLLSLPLKAERIPILLWPNGAPEQAPHSVPQPKPSVRFTDEGEQVVTHVEAPSITPFLPYEDAATGAAVIIAPGGGHAEIWIEHEGYREAEWLQAHGVAAFVLQYRLAREKGSAFTVEGTELGDMQRAIRVVRSRSIEWHLDPNRIGVMGFSAGGELAELAASRFDSGSGTARDTVDRISSRPSFQALIYPALPMDPRLTAQSPPAFLACGADDRPGIAEGLPEFFLALKKLNVSAELHVYAGIGHGFGIRASNAPAVADRMQTFLNWLGSEHMMSRH